jgi:pyruvate dehydrogenase E1 component beta subunit
MNMPGFKIIAPSTPADMKGLLKSAVRDDDPVLSFEDGTLWATKGEVPEDGDVLIPLGEAEVKRPGTDVTIVAIAGTVPLALAAAAELEGSGVSVEVLDPRTLVPLDTAAILASVEKTGRLVVADPAHRTCSAASEISALVAEDGFWSLKAPIQRVTTPASHVPYSPALEKQMYPTTDKIVQAVRRTLE